MKSNFHLPSEYRNQKDYREIPSHLLIKNIPQGRGMIKWTPFATAPMLFNNINQQIKDQVKIEKPILSEDQVAEINFLLKQLMNKPSSCKIKYFREGYIIESECIVELVDFYKNLVMVYLCNEEHRLAINADDIIEVII